MAPCTDAGPDYNRRTHQGENRVDRKLIYVIAYTFVMAIVTTGTLLVVARGPTGQPIELAEPPTPRPLWVDVKGAVSAPGVYPLPRGSVWRDAIATAGGPLPLADLDRLNLAQPVVQGDLIIVSALTLTPTPPPPSLTPRPTVTVGPGTPSPTSAPSSTAAPTSQPVVVTGAININTATLEELDSLPGIGPAIGQRIIDYRTQHGPFRDIAEIQNVRGIGPATFERIKNLITVGP